MLLGKPFTFASTRRYFVNPWTYTGLLAAGLVVLWLCAGALAGAQTFTTLDSFNGTDGGNAAAALIQGKDGDLYGTTSTGGAHFVGSIFKITPSGTLTTVYSFCAQPGCPDGEVPMASLVQATDGNFYGATEFTIFRLTPSGTLTVLHSFSGTDGQFPIAALIQGSDGNLYGTTERGGTNRCTLRASYIVGCGTIFKITLSGTLTTLVDLTATTGWEPSAPLVEGRDGNFYGTMTLGGASKDGVVFKMTPAGTLTVLHSFSGTDGEKPLGSLVEGADGNFYGTTSFGGASAGFGGTVFKITAGGTLTTLHSFDGSDGSGAAAGLILATDGNFYGTTSTAGMANTGTVFRITPSGTMTVLHTFDGADGELPYAALVQGANGELYGATEYGANSACTEGCGTVFSLSAP
jgi:uncharacterized repeat protein (TIGR03803 family)